MKWLGLGAGRRELKELEKTTIDKRIFIQIRVCLREGKVMAAGSDVGIDYRRYVLSCGIN